MNKKGTLTGLPYITELMHTMYSLVGNNHEIQCTDWEKLILKEMRPRKQIISNAKIGKKFAVNER